MGKMGDLEIMMLTALQKCDESPAPDPPVEDQRVYIMKYVNELPIDARIDLANILRPRADLKRCAQGLACDIDAVPDEQVQKCYNFMRFRLEKTHL